MNDAPRVLVVDDDVSVSEMLVRSLARHGFATEAVPPGDPAWQRIEAGDFEAAVMDLVMPGHSGVDLVRVLRERFPDVPVAILTGYANSPLIKQAQEAGARVFSKPVAIEELVDYLEAELPRRLA